MIYEEAIKQMLEGNQLLIRRAIDGAHYDSTKVGVVISDGTNEGYKIRVGSLEYDNVDSLNNAQYTPNQIVMVTMPQNSLGDMYITGAIGSSPVGGGSSSGGSGGDGTTNYLSLSNKPKINGVTLSGNISGSALGLLDSSAVSDWAKSDTKPTYTAEEVGALPNTTEIPTKTSDLVNDSGFITSVPTATSSQLGVVKVDGETITINNGVISSVGSDYTALTNKPSINGVTLQGSKSLSDLGISIPTNVSDLTNDSGYVTDTQVSNWINGIDIKYDATTAKPMWRPRGGTDYSPFGSGDGGGLSFTSEYRYGTISSVSVTSSAKTASVTFDRPMTTSSYNVLVSPVSNVCVSVYSRTKTTLTLSFRARSSSSGVGTYNFTYLAYK